MNMREYQVAGDWIFWAILSYQSRQVQVVREGENDMALPASGRKAMDQGVDCTAGMLYGFLLTKVSLASDKVTRKRNEL